MSNDDITPKTLESISKVITVLTAADSFSPAEFEEFIYDFVDDDIEEAVILINGIIGFFFAMADSVHVDMKTSLESFGIAAATQLIQKENDN